MFRHRALSWVLCAELFRARSVHVMWQHRHNGSILDTLVVANWLKIKTKVVLKQVNFAPNWLQDRRLARPDAPTLTEALTASSWPRFWTPFGVSFGCPLESKLASKLNLETIHKEYTFCISKNTPLEANLGIIFKHL